MLTNSLQRNSQKRIFSQAFFAMAPRERPLLEPPNATRQRTPFTLPVYARLAGAAAPSGVHRAKGGGGTSRLVLELDKPHRTGYGRTTRGDVGEAARGKRRGGKICQGHSGRLGTQNRKPPWGKYGRL